MHTQAYSEIHTYTWQSHKVNDIKTLYNDNGYSTSKTYYTDTHKSDNV